MKKFIPYLMLLLTLVGFTRLGFWQLDRYQQKLDAVAEFEAAAKGVPATLLNVKDIPRADNGVPSYERVTVEGKFHPQKSFLWDNRVLNQRVGYQIITPFQLTNEQWLLVDRGWLPASPDRVILPVFRTPQQKTTLVGLLRALPEAALRLNAVEETGWPRRVQYLNNEELSKAFEGPLADAVLWLSADEPGVFEPLQAAVSMPPAKHLGYAVQWFALAFTALVLIVIIWGRRRQTKEK